MAGPKKMTFTFDSSRKSQAGVANLFAALTGKAPPPKCSTCGGVTKDYKGTVPERGRCSCEETSDE